MSLDRRQLLTAAACAATRFSGLPVLSMGAARPGIKALAFDAFPVFDPGPIFMLAEELFPGKGAELSSTWRTRQFEYTWLRTLSRTYADFWRVTEDALVFAAKMLKLDLTQEKRNQLMEAYLHLKAYPDVTPALHWLKDAGIRLAFLSNMTGKMLDASITNSGLEGIFETALSTDSVKSYKPDPRAYKMGTETLRLKREEIVFVAFAGWDAAGAKAFGYTTFWMNRLNLPAEELGELADATGANFADLVAFVKAAR